MAKKALILIEGTRGNGAAYVQAARSLGFHPVTLSADPSLYDYLATDGSEAIRVDTDNLEALIRECVRLSETNYDIAGITSVGDPFYAMVGKLCRYFGLPGPNPASIERCCDKFSQRQQLADAGVPVPAFRLALDAVDVKRSAEEIGLPVILKPAVGSGSSGVRLCRSIEELAEHTAHLFGGTHIWRSPPRVLVEEFAEGPYYSVTTMGNDVLGIAAADFGRPPHFIFREFTFPAELSEDEHQHITNVSLSGLQALGLGWGPTNIELRWTRLGPVVIEVNPRLAGTPDPQLIRLAHGIDVIAEHIRLVSGNECNLRKRHSHTAAARFLVPDRNGTLDWIDGHSRAAAIPGVAEVKLYVKPTTPLVCKGDDRDWIGHVIAASPSLDLTKAILQRAVESICWSITPLPSLLGTKEGQYDTSAGLDV